MISWTTLIACGDDPTFEDDCGRWGSIPLATTVDPDGRRFDRDAEAAGEIWNRAVDTIIFSHLGEIALDGAITIHGTADLDHAEARKFILTGSCDIIGAEVHVPYASVDPILRIAHELGHTLDLAHDLDPDSIMNPAHRAGSDVTEEDAVAIRERYGL